MSRVELMKSLRAIQKTLAKETPGLTTSHDVEAIPIEQLKGDIARQGHPIARTIALDIDNNRLFFVGKDGSFLFAEYGTAEEGYALKRVGSQGEIAKEYDPVDLKPEPFSSVETEHEEEEQDDKPGMIPAGTPAGTGTNTKKNVSRMNILRMKTLTKISAPQQRGLVLDPVSHRWKKPDAGKPSPQGHKPERTKEVSVTQSKVVTEAVSHIERELKGKANVTPDKAALMAGSLWFNMGSARSSFKNSKAFQQAVREKVS